MGSDTRDANAKPRDSYGRLGKLVVEYIEVERLSQHPDNANSGDMEALEESIRVNEFYSPIIVQRSTGYIVAGNHRWLVAVKRGMPTIPAIILDLTDAEAKRMMIADNRITRLGHDDEALIMNILEDLQDTDDGLHGTGYTTDDLQHLVDDLDTPLDLTEPEPEDQAPALPVLKSDLTFTPVEGHDGHCIELTISKDDGKPLTASDVNRIRRACGYPKMTDQERESFGIEAWEGHR